MTLVVRPLTAADFASIDKIDDEVHGQRWSRRTLRDQVEQEDRFHIVVCDDDGVAAHGALWFDAAQARVTNVAVAANKQGRGIGTVVMQELCKRARSSQASTMSLEVAPTNRSAQALYRRFGFAPVGIERSFYGPGKDALAMAVVDLQDPAWIQRTTEHRRSEHTARGVA